MISAAIQHVDDKLLYQFFALHVTAPLRDEKDFAKELDAAGIDLTAVSASACLSTQINGQAIDIIQRCAPSAPYIQTLTMKLLTETTNLNITLHAYGKVLSITRLALATLLKQPYLVDHLLQKGHQPNTCDSQGYTALHIAAMVDQLDVLKLLWQAGGRLRAQTHQGLSVIDILKARGFAKASTQKVTVFKGVDLAIPEVQSITGRKYLQNNIYSIDALLISWTKKHQNTEFSELVSPVNANYLETYANIQKGKLPYDPPVYIRKMAAGSPLAGQFELVAKRPIKAGEYVMEYTAYVIDEDLPNSPYAYGGHGVSFDAEKGGSFAEIANQGPPNCYVTTIIYKGLERSLMIASTPIGEGETIRLNYGESYFSGRKIPFTELAPEKVDDFLLKTKNLTDFYSFAYQEPLEDYLPCSQNSTCSVQVADVRSYVRDMKDYLYEFPDHLFDLIKAKKLPAGAVSTFFTQFYLSRNAERLHLRAGYHDELINRMLSLTN